MLTYTCCRSCLMPLIPTRDDQHCHDDCPPKLTEIEKLTADYLYTVQHHGDEAAKGHADALWEAQHKPPDLRAAALYYARNYGWPVFPLRRFGGPCDGEKECEQRCQCPKKPRLKSHGFKDATTDLAQIDLWWSQHDYNIGIPTGHFFDVIDVDPPRGWESWHDIQKLVLPDIHGRVATASGGAHFYVLPTGGGNRAGIYPGIDYRGAGGYVVAPPSWLGENRYSWSWGMRPSPFIIPTLKGNVSEWQAVQA